MNTQMKKEKFRIHIYIFALMLMLKAILKECIVKTSTKDVIFKSKFIFAVFLALVWDLALVQVLEWVLLEAPLH